MILRRVLGCVCLAGLLVSGCSGYNQSSIPNVPYVNLDIHRQNHALTYTDRICVFNAGDMITDTGTRYRNSGLFLYEILMRTMQQYNVDGAVRMPISAEGQNLVYLQDYARRSSCNVLALARPVFWQDSQISPGNVGYNIDMFDTSSLELLNSVTLNARSSYIRDMFEENSPLKPVIETYVDQLYH